MFSVAPEKQGFQPTSFFRLAGDSPGTPEFVTPTLDSRLGNFVRVERSRGPSGAGGYGSLESDEASGGHSSPKSAGARQLIPRQNLC
jgi:hypothetical protein